jgi:hypothetical protein
MLGGQVLKGGRIHGKKYPNGITPTGDLNVGRGNIIPTTSWDAIWTGVLEWAGVDTRAGLDYCVPNRANTDLLLTG